MGLISYTNGQTSVILRVKIIDSATLTGGKTGLAYNSSGLIISTIADNEASATAYTVAGSTIETISTLGTYAAPTATKCRFKEVDATNHKGVYEIHIADARFAVSNAKSVLISLTGASGMCDCDVVIPLTSLNPYDLVRAGLTALPNAAAGASSGVYVIGGTGVTVATNNDKTNYSLSSSGVDNVVIESGCNLRQAVSVIGAAVAGSSTAVDTGSPVFKGLGVTTTRISATATSGNRSSVTLSLPS